MAVEKAITTHLKVLLNLLHRLFDSVSNTGMNSSGHICQHVINVRIGHRSTVQIFCETKAAEAETTKPNLDDPSYVARRNTKENRRFIRVAERCNKLDPQ